MSEEFQINDLRCEIIRKARQKNIYFRIRPEDGTVRISAAKGVRRTDLVDYVKEHYDKLLSMRNRVLEMHGGALKNYETGELHGILGRRLPLEVCHDGETIAVEQCADRIILTVPEGSDIAFREAVMKEWYREVMRRILPDAVRRCEARTGLQAADYRIRKMETHWGSCTPSTRCIRLSINLAEKDLLCTDYVLTHELVHLLERRHSARFYKLLYGFFPEWKEAERLLKSKAPENRDRR